MPTLTAHNGPFSEHRHGTDAANMTGLKLVPHFVVHPPAHLAFGVAERGPVDELRAKRAMSSAEENKALIRYLIERGLNDGDPDVAVGRFTDDYVAHIPGIPSRGPTGPDVFRGVMQLWRRSFSDWHMTIEELIAERDCVTNRFITTGTHDGPLFGIPPTGKRIVVRSQETHRIAGGKVAESWIVDDVPGILVQLGVLHLPFPPADRLPPVQPKERVYRDPSRPQRSGRRDRRSSARLATVVAGGSVWTRGGPRSRRLAIIGACPRFRLASARRW